MGDPTAAAPDHIAGAGKLVAYREAIARIIDPLSYNGMPSAEALAKADAIIALIGAGREEG